MIAMHSNTMWISLQCRNYSKILCELQEYTDYT